jgi:hypothetical protein
MKLDKLRRITDEIIDSEVTDPDARKEMYATKYPNFAEKYPTLFGTCCASCSDAEKAKTKSYVMFLLDMLEKTHTESMSTHDASVCVGQRLYDDFVAPNLNTSK